MSLFYPIIHHLLCHSIKRVYDTSICSNATVKMGTEELCSQEGEENMLTEVNLLLYD